MPDSTARTSGDRPDCGDCPDCKAPLISIMGTELGYCPFCYMIMGCLPLKELVDYARPNPSRP